MRRKNKTKILGELLVISMSIASVSATCPNGRVAVGMKAGVNFAKVKIGSDKGNVSLKKLSFQ